MDIYFVLDYKVLAEDPFLVILLIYVEDLSPREIKIGPVQLFSLNPLKWLTNSGKVSHLTMYFKD